MSRHTQVATLGAVLCLGLAAFVSSQAAEEEPLASSFVSLKLEGECDAKNKRLWLTNTHTFKTIITKVRWRAAGGKDLQDEMYPPPNTVREIGCAAEGEILEAKFADF
jgi:hypothetical protein